METKEGTTNLSKRGLRLRVRVQRMEMKTSTTALFGNIKDLLQGSIPPFRTGNQYERRTFGKSSAQQGAACLKFTLCALVQLCPSLLPTQDHEASTLNPAANWSLGYAGLPLRKDKSPQAGYRLKPHDFQSILQRTSRALATSGSELDVCAGAHAGT